MFFSYLFAKFRQRGSKRFLEGKAVCKRWGGWGEWDFERQIKWFAGVIIVSPSVRADDQPLILGLYKCKIR